MDEADVEALPLGAALLVHEAGHVSGDDVSGAGGVMISDLVVAHLGRNRFFENGKSAAEAAAFVRPARRHEFDATHLAEQIERLGEERFVDFRCFCGAKLAKCAARIVDADLVRKFSPGESLDFQDIMQELDQLISAASHLLHWRGLSDRIQVFPHMVGAASRWGDDVIEVLEVIDEQRLCAGCVLLAPAVRHHLAAAGLVEGKEDLDIAGNEQSHSHDRLSSRTALSNGLSKLTLARLLLMRNGPGVTPI